MWGWRGPSPPSPAPGPVSRGCTWPSPAAPPPPTTSPASPTRGARAIDPARRQLVGGRPADVPGTDGAAAPGGRVGDLGGPAGPGGRPGGVPFRGGRARRSPRGQRCALPAHGMQSTPSRIFRKTVTELPPKHPCFSIERSHMGGMFPRVVLLLAVREALSSCSTDQSMHLGRWPIGGPVAVLRAHMGFRPARRPRHAPSPGILGSASREQSR